LSLSRPAALPLSRKFPLAIARPPQRSRMLQIIFDLGNISLDADASGARLQILRKRQIRGILHCRRGAAQLWCDDFARSTAECDSHRADHHARPLASAVDTADSYGLDKSRNLDRATVARERRRLDGERPAMQNHATGKIRSEEHTSELQ